VINVKFAKKALEKGADGLVAVAAGAGGHAGVCSPFALVHEIREFFDGPLALSGSIATGRGVLAARAAGADFAYIGSAFIATTEANASEAYKQARLQSQPSRLQSAPGADRPDLALTSAHPLCNAGGGRELFGRHCLLQPLHRGAPDGPSKPFGPPLRPRPNRLAWWLQGRLTAPA
jgi:hypothetical protein